MMDWMPFCASAAIALSNSPGSFRVTTVTDIPSF